jgi:CelD/BcsL family acetyltransferase involved in cellulose biosynthesis
MMTIERIEDSARFADLREEWGTLLAASPSNCLFLTWEWLSTWWKHLAGRRRLNLLLVRDGRELAAIAPLAWRPPALFRLIPFPALEFLGTGIVGSDHLDIIVRRGREREVHDALAAALADAPSVLELAQVHPESSFAAKFAQRFGRKERSIRDAVTDICPFIDLAGHTWESYLESLGPAHRYNVRRRMRNLTKHFDVRFEQVQTEAERHDALSALVAFHTSRWRERGGSEAFETPELLSFYDEMSRLALQRGWLRLFVLRLNGRPTAVFHGYRYGRVFYFYQSGFDLTFTKESVGLVTLALTIQRAIEEGATEYDLLRGAEPYKFLWTHKARELSRFELFPPGMRGAVWRSLAGASGRLRRTARSVLGDSVAERIANRGWFGVWARLGARRTGRNRDSRIRRAAVERRRGPWPASWEEDEAETSRAVTAPSSRSR